MARLHAAFHNRPFWVLKAEDYSDVLYGINIGASSMLFRLFVFPAVSPVPTISWKRADGASFGRKVDMNKASGVLEIPYFQMEDAGVYECVAENSRGRNSVKGKLSFYGEWEDGSSPA